MRLHPNAAVRVLRNELERLEEADQASAAAIDRLTQPGLERFEFVLKRMGVIRDITDERRKLAQEATEIEDALMILEAGLEVAPVLSEAEAVFA